MKKQPQITEQTRKTLIKAFLQLNKKTEIQKITINRICKTANFNRSTFYQYFSDIYDLRNYIEDELLGKLDILFKSNLSKIHLENYLEIFLGFYSENSEAFLILLGQNGDPYFYQKIKNTLKPTIYNVLSVDDNNIESDYIIEFTMSAMISTISYWFEKNKNLNMNELSKLLYAIISTSILPLLKNKM